MTATTRGWLGDVALAALFTCLAWALRHWGGYPMCPGDEASWLQIAGELDRGRAWPVSGPGYMAAVQALAHRLEQPTAAAIPLWGIASVFGVLLTLLRVYRQLGPMPPWLACAGLALSSYFLAPVFESRPQQWGQALVLLGAWLCWRWLHASKGAWVFFAVLALTAVLHILSHAILVWVCMALLIGDALLGQARAHGRRHVATWLALLLSMGVYLLPGGPYAHMLRDIQQHHMGKLGASPLIHLLMISMGMVVLSLIYRANWTNTLNKLKHKVQSIARHPTGCMLALALVLVMALTGQAALLPPEAWRPYGGSPAAFVLFQAGNLATAWCFMAGLLVSIRAASAFNLGPHSPRLAPLSAQFLAIALLALAVLAGVVILASLWLLHTNWLLRLISYGLLFAAPIVALGMQHIARAWPVWLRAIAATALMGLSLAAVLKPPPIFVC